MKAHHEGYREDMCEPDLVLDGLMRAPEASEDLMVSLSNHEVRAVQVPRVAACSGG
jgi:hypothetical protein